MMPHPDHLADVGERRTSPRSAVRVVVGVPVFLVLTLAGGALLSGGQGANAEQQYAQFRKVFPSATAFSSRLEDPPHFKAYRDDPRTGGRTLAGVVFWTTDLEPLERGYGGPIRILVGMNMNGILSGILVVDHREPYADFSIDLPEYAAQFTGKDIRDPFRLGADIDAVARATVTTSSATRAVKNSARRVARELLTPSKRQAW